MSKQGIKENFMIGYFGGSSQPTLNSMIDGMVNMFSSRQDLANSLTKGDYIPIELKKEVVDA